MINIFVHNGMDDLYNIMVVDNNVPICSDQVRGKYALERELSYLEEEFFNQNKLYKVVGYNYITA